MEEEISKFVVINFLFLRSSEVQKETWEGKRGEGISRDQDF